MLIRTLSLIGVMALSNAALGVVVDSGQAPITLRSSDTTPMTITVTGEVAKDLYDAGDRVNGAKDGVVSIGKKATCSKKDSTPKKIPGLPEGGIVPMTTYSCTLSVDSVLVQGAKAK